MSDATNAANPDNDPAASAATSPPADRSDAVVAHATATPAQIELDDRRDRDQDNDNRTDGDGEAPQRGDEPDWEALCLAQWRSLAWDRHAWALLGRGVDADDPARWEKAYEKVSGASRWTSRLQKTGTLVCNVVAHHVAGAPLDDAGLPAVLDVERRFNVLHLHTFVLHDASFLYFEPEAESDRAGFDDFIDYLHKRTRAGLALEDQRRFIFIPPCEYTRTHMGYNGGNLLGIVQNAFPPLTP